MRFGLRLYRLLLWSLPAADREEYGPEMEAVVQDQRAELGEHPGFWVLTGFWLRQYGAVVRARAEWRRRNRTRGGEGMTGLLNGFVTDLWHSVRGLRKRIGFTAVAALTLAVGIGASTAVFSAIQAVLLRDLPLGDPDRTLVLVREDRSTGELGNGVAVANMRDLAERAGTLVSAAAADPFGYDLIVDGRAESLRGWWAAEGFLEALEPHLHLGRLFTADEYAAQAADVMILSWSAWVGRFGADSTLVGREIVLAEGSHTVVGVLEPFESWPGPADLWTPRPAQPYDAFARSSAYMPGVARLAAGASLEQARAELDGIARSMARENPKMNGTLSWRVTPLREHLFGDVSTPLFVLAAAVGLVLLIACANVAGLLVARGIERRREFALRDALGAGRARLIRLMAIESGVIAILGGGIGLALAYGGVAAIRLLGPDHLPRIGDLSVNFEVLLFALGAALLSAVLSGLAPALRLRESQPADALRDGRAGISHSRAGVTIRRRLVVLEVAGAMVLLVGAGLLLKSFSNLLDEELGFEPENRLALQTFAYGYEGTGLDDFVRGAVTALEAIPGVEKVALTTNVPAANEGALASIDIDMAFTVDDRPSPPVGQEPQAWVTWISAGLFEVLGQPVVRGRSFSAIDGPDAERVAMVNEAFARRHFGGEDPVGRSVTMGEDPVSHRIVGVAADLRPNGHDSAPRPEIYLPLSQGGRAYLTFLARTSVPPATLAEAARQAIWDTNPLQAIWGVATLESLVSDRLTERRFNLSVLGVFALTALFLAGIGIYGLGSYSVRVRRNELGIRRALGGQASEILRLMLVEGTRLGALGVAFGLVAALVATRALQGMLFGVEPTDPVVLVGLAAGVLAISVLAALSPAVQAGRVDPAEALRAD